MRRSFLLPSGRMQGSVCRSGCVIGADGIIRVAHNGILSAIHLESGLLWSLSLEQFEYCSVPAALEDGSVALITGSGLAIVGDAGILTDTLDTEMCPDDSGLSPCITYDGRVVVSSSLGDVYLLDSHNLWVSLGVFGYDIVSPTVYKDDTIGISGYYHAGFTRLRLDGSTVWNTGIFQADLLSSTSPLGDTAVASLNDNTSHIYSASGEAIGTYPRASLFAQHLDSRWIARSAGYLALLERDGRTVWEVQLDGRPDWGLLQPIVDAEGFVFVQTTRGLTCTDPKGQPVFHVSVPPPWPSPIAAVAEGLLAYVAGSALWLVA